MSPACRFGCAQACDTKVEQLYARRRQHDVRRFEIAMDHALTMRVIESIGDFDRMAHDLIDGQRPPDHARCQGLAIERLHHKEREPILLADIV